jgi:hypothetical protein
VSAPISASAWEGSKELEFTRWWRASASGKSFPHKFGNLVTFIDIYWKL